MEKSLAAGAASFALLLALSACTTGSPPADADTSAPRAPEEPTPAPEVADALLMTADSSLGEIVVDGEGMTVYMFDNDIQGATTSSCSGQCAADWPAVTMDSESPIVEGVTSEIGAIMGIDGALQVTLNGWPLYHFAGDAAAGDVNGQGMNELWWVLTPAGERVPG